MNRARRLLPVILLVAMAVRLWGIGFGLPFVNARPDETQIAGAAVGFLTGNLRPPLLEWPTLFPYVVALIYAAYVAIARPFGGYPTLAAFAESRRVSLDPFLYVTRGLSAVMGVVTVGAVYAVGRRVFDETVGVVAASFLALSFLHVRDSHFGVTDVAMTAMIVLAVLAILRWRETGGLARAAGAGVAVGLAASTKYNGLGACVPFGVALILRFEEERHVRTDALKRATLALAVFGTATAMALFATSPYILIDWSRFLSNVSATQQMLAQGHGMALGRGWWYYARVVLPAAVGWPIFVAGAVGALVLLTTRLKASAVVLAFPVAYYVVAGRGLGVFARYIVPVVPFLCLSAAWLTVEAARFVTQGRSAAVRRLVTAVATIALVAPTAYKTWLLDRLLSTTDNRTIAGRAVAGIALPNSIVYQSGESYGHVPLAEEGRPLAVRIAKYDEGSGQFRPGEPDWILVQRSPLALYSAVPPWLDRLLKDRYVLARRFPTEETQAERTYDQQDAFYLPLEGLKSLRRPGPAFELYSRRAD